MRMLALVVALFVHTANAAPTFTLTSTNLRNDAIVPMAQLLDGNGCNGGNLSPQLSWSGAPAGARSFAITMFDPDAPGGHGWWHWLVFDIPAVVHGLPENAGTADSRTLPAGAEQGRNDFGFSHYGGPCPPPGDPPHRYIVTVYALKVAKLPLGAGEPGPEFAAALRTETIATAQITARYGRR